MLKLPAHQLGQQRSIGRRPLSLKPTSSAALGKTHKRTKQAKPCLAILAEAPAAPASTVGQGHTKLLHALGDVGEIPAAQVPSLLRISHAQAAMGGGDTSRLLQANARGLASWRIALARGLLPDDVTLQQLVDSGETFTAGHSVEELAWPEEPLRTMLLRALSKLGVAYFAQKYPGVRDALLKSLLEAVSKYHKTLAGQVEEEVRETDAQGNRYKTIKEVMEEEEQRKARLRAATAAEQQQLAAEAIAAKAAADDESRRKAAALASLPEQKRVALELVKALFMQWQAPLSALSKAGRAFEGLEALLGGGPGGSFDLQGNIWKRAGWGQMDTLRKKLEDLKELRDLVRSLGRGGGWGPLRRAPIQYLDLNARPGLLRTVLEAQETRGLTRSDDISRLLPSESALLARGRSQRWARLLFYSKLVEKALQTYERDGWGEFPTNIVPERREIRPTADRGPILLCVDTSGSMRGPRETVAKALALECMRAAREQERNCYVFAFSGPAEVRELELNNDLKSVNNLLDFLEKVFNGGSDFNEPVKRCLDRVTDAKWANSDILLVSDGELRQPGPEIMRKLSGAKEKLGLRVHGLIIGSPEKQRADPAVLRALCTGYLPNGKVEVLVSLFENWASVQQDDSLNFDWDDKEGNTRRRLAGLALEKKRQEEVRRRRTMERSSSGGQPKSAVKSIPAAYAAMPGKGKKH